MVRDTLGEDAVIVSTREEKGGKAVQITAAVEPAFEVGFDGRPAERDDWLQYDDEMDEGQIAEELTDVLLRHSVPEDILDQIISCAGIIGPEQPHIALIAALEHLFNYRPLPQKPAQKAFMMIGAPGAGKTLAVAKMAARGVMNGLKIGVITTDTIRAGGVEQLQAFTKLLKVDLIKVDSARDLRYAVADLGECDQVLIDTAGFNPFNKNEVKETAKLIGAADIAALSLVPGGIDAEEAGEMGRIFSTIGSDTFITTRLDIARRFGGLLAAAHQGKLSFADASHTPQVADGLTPVTPKTLAKLFMPTRFKTSYTEPQNDSRDASARPSSSPTHPPKKRLRQ